MAKEADSRIRFLAILLTVILVVLLWSNVGPKDRLTWFMEVLPVLIVLPILTYTWQSFPLTRLLYLLLFLHGIVLMVGGHYTYAEVPVGFWFQEVFDLQRNHYDRLGHFVQGFVPAILVREILIRKTCLQAGKLLFFIVLSICLGFSAFYELIEWWAALLYGGAADAFLSKQGDIWDTQWDMLFALLGAIAAQLMLAGIHDRQLAKLKE
jgi:putative membrane protein